MPEPPTDGDEAPTSDRESSVGGRWRGDGERPQPEAGDRTRPPADGGDRERRSSDGDREPRSSDAGDRDGPTADGGDPERPLADGGTEAGGPDDVVLDPWGASTVADYRALFEEFGIEEFDEVLPEVPDPHYLMRRGVIFGHRDYRPVAAAMREGEPFAALSGFMPTGDPHVGHKLVFDELIWHQERGGDVYALVADLEAHSARGMDWDEIDEHARDYLLSLLALGFDPGEGTLYRQSTNREVQDLAFELGIEANFSELSSIYGFTGETDVSHMQSVVTQMADILYPQLSGPKPTVIPVGPDQDPHVRLARDLAARMRYFGVTETYASFEVDDDDERELLAAAYGALAAGDGDAASSGEGDADGGGGADAAEDAGTGGDDAGAGGDDAGTGSDAAAGGDDAAVTCADAADWLREHEPAPGRARESLVEKLDAAGREPLRPRVRVLDREATDEAFDALVEAVPGEKRVHGAHVDAFDLSRADAEALAREVELDHGGYGFVAPSSVYHRFMTGLTGGKMSSSVPASHISLLDDPGDGYDKVKAATTGGRETAELQRELGGEADECPVYELYAYLLAGDDDEFAKRVYDECVGGERLCGDCKEQAAELMAAFLEDHQERRAEVAAELEALDVPLDVAGRRRG